MNNISKNGSDQCEPEQAQPFQTDPNGPGQNRAQELGVASFKLHKPLSNSIQLALIKTL